MHASGSGRETANAQDYGHARASASAAAARMAADPALKPGTPEGDTALEYLLACVYAVAGPHASATDGTSEAAVTSASEGILALLGRDDWMTSPAAAQIQAASMMLLDEPQPDASALAISTLPQIEPDPAKRLDLILQRLRSDKPVFLRVTLLRQLLILSADIPADVDADFSGLGATDAWPSLSAARKNSTGRSPQPRRQPETPTPSSSS